ncbi:hypothetical protein LSTR_LSTR005892 [Laodelphax striatellus]|uniref:Uncharacterized protein n=1 Tax=Laodelphax striatellus TaxID=195883 RepID=A0A482WR51_LAOST|nr:hypothetical protein LSTR_LSTR005891 [Laodelphax striatellus]RZF36076.1 hypothetical protein LSTR_LSTR005892 [Laodelphax striatellus]
MPEASYLALSSSAALPKEGSRQLLLSGSSRSRLPQGDQPRCAAPCSPNVVTGSRPNCGSTRSEGSTRSQGSTQSTDPLSSHPARQIQVMLNSKIRHLSTLGNTTLAIWFPDLPYICWSWE